MKITWAPDLATVRVAKFPEVKVQWYRTIVDATWSAWLTGVQSGKSGVKYRRLPRRSSAPGEYPSYQSGGLVSATQRGVNSREGYIGNNLFYAKFLDDGTSQMAPRKMYKGALKDVIAAEGGRGLEGYLKWTA